MPLKGPRKGKEPHYEEKRNQSIKTDQEKIKMVQSDKDIKIDITSLPMFKKLEERLKRHRTQKMLKKKKDPNWTSRNKNYNVWNLKNMLDGVNGRLDVTEEKISESEDIGIETIQNEMQREKDFKNE